MSNHEPINIYYQNAQYDSSDTEATVSQTGLFMMTLIVLFVLMVLSIRRRNRLDENKRQLAELEADHNNRINQYNQNHARIHNLNLHPARQSNFRQQQYPPQSTARSNLYQRHLTEQNKQQDTGYL
jgi:hypothetical protein